MQLMANAHKDKDEDEEDIGEVKIQGQRKGVPKHCFFTCRTNVTCLPSRHLGDAHKDCADGEDERLTDDGYAMECLTDLGAPCVPSSWICDDISDCLDGRDEQGCVQDAGGTDGCQTISCDLPGLLDPISVPPHQICDGYPDCVSGEDEQGCSGSVSTQTATSSSSG
uniref:Uncharacterized protein n=1 Tax=Branchiostoma floridae TaxID=7739 RepID=C3ZUH2_BRAFL|eukprot:XP_002587800.1 hypothetical protein BRAFLDRAFT_92245 [Branchiostoma floridae]